MSKNKNINIIYSNLYLFNEKNNKKKIFSKDILYNGKITQKLLDKFKMPILTTLLRKKIFKKYKFEKNYNIIGDFDFFIKVSLSEKVLSMQEPLAYYRIHSSSMSTRRLDLNISELENWINVNRTKKQYKYLNFSAIHYKIQTLKIKYNLLSGYRLKALKELLKIPIQINNFKFFPFIFLPNNISKMFF